MDAYIKGSDDKLSYMIDINELHASSSNTALMNVVNAKSRGLQNEQLEYLDDLDLYCYEVMSD